MNRHNSILLAIVAASRRRGLAYCAACLAGSMSPRAAAQCTGPACQNSDLAAAFTSNGTTFACADNFTFAEPTIVDTVCWRGIQIVFGPPVTDCSSTSVDNFRIQFFADTGECVPGIQLAEFSQAAGTLTGVTRVATGNTILDIPEFEWTATLAGGFFPDARLCNWIEITNPDSPGNCIFLWMSSADGDSAFVQDDLTGYDPSDLDHTSDLSFCLGTFDDQPFIPPACLCEPPCPNPDHDCLTEGTPGCSDEACCNTVCTIDAFCCSDSWDSICVTEANEICSFCDPGGTPGAHNIDFGFEPTAPRPSESFGAASGQAGFWNTVPLKAAGTPVALCDLSAQTTAATITSANNNPNFFFNNAGTTGDTQNLMDDLLDLGGAGATDTFTIAGLPNGTYDVYTYAWAPDNATFVTSVNVNGTGAQNVGGAWPGSFALGVTHALHTVNVTSGTITVTTSTVSGFSSINGVQLAPKGGGAECPADIAPAAGGNCAADGDGTIGAGDLGELLANWGANPTNGCADIAPVGAPDGTVGAGDLGELLANWGQCS